MTRGTDANYAFVMTDSPRKSDPAAGPAAAPELARFEWLERFRAGLQLAEPGVEAGEDDGRRDAAAGLAGGVERDRSDPSATQHRTRQPPTPTHRALLTPTWH